MALIVQKFGGTSVGGIERIKHVAKLAKAEYDKGNQVVIVVSAMAGTTDELVNKCSSMANIDTKDQLAEYDSVLASGEQITCGLVALAISALGTKSTSVLGWQLKIQTDDSFGSARIEKIEVAKLHELLANNVIPVVAGFQGVTIDERITTLGRGGSDTSAVAIAAALKADRCDIYTDVDGVYTADPRIVTKARKLDRLSYEEMLELASLGAKVLHARSVEVAMKHKIVLQVLSSFVDKKGTFIINEDKLMEERIITGLTYNRGEARITLRGIIDRPGVAADIFNPLAEGNINIDMIVQAAGYKVDGVKKTDITFTIPKKDLSQITVILEKAKSVIKFDELDIDQNIAKISVIGVGMRSHTGVAKEMFDVLGNKGINIQAISTSEIKISVLISEEYTELALRALHTAYNLDEEEENL